MIRTLTPQDLWERELKGPQNTKQVKAWGKGWCKGQPSLVRGGQSRARASRGHPRSSLPHVVLPGAEGGVQIVCQGLPMDWMCSLAFIRKAAMLVLRGSASSKGNLSTKVAPHW